VSLTAWQAVGIRGAGRTTQAEVADRVLHARGAPGAVLHAAAPAGISDRAGYPLSFARFFRVGFPAMLVTVSLASLWLLVRYALF